MGVRRGWEWELGVPVGSCLPLEITPGGCAALWPRAEGSQGILSLLELFQTWIDAVGLGLETLRKPRPACRRRAVRPPAFKRSLCARRSVVSAVF